MYIHHDYMETVLVHKAFDRERFDGEFYDLEPEIAMEALTLFIPGGRKVGIGRKDAGQSRNRTKTAAVKRTTWGNQDASNTKRDASVANGWKLAVLDRVDELRGRTGKRVVTLQDFYSHFLDDLTGLYPNVVDVKAQIRYVFQELIKDEKLARVKPGHYRIR